MQPFLTISETVKIIRDLELEIGIGLFFEHLLDILSFQFVIFISEPWNPAQHQKKTNDIKSDYCTKKWFQ